MPTPVSSSLSGAKGSQGDGRRGGHTAELNGPAERRKSCTLRSSQEAEQVAHIPLPFSCCSALTRAIYTVWTLELWYLSGAVLTVLTDCPPHSTQTLTREATRSVKLRAEACLQRGESLIMDRQLSVNPASNC